MGPTALLPLRRKACLGFFRPKNLTASAGFEPANLGTKGHDATPRTPKPFLSFIPHKYFICIEASPPQTWTQFYCTKVDTVFGWGCQVETAQFRVFGYSWCQHLEGEIMPTPFVNACSGTKYLACKTFASNDSAGGPLCRLVLIYLWSESPEMQRLLTTCVLLTDNEERVDISSTAVYLSAASLRFYAPV